MLAVVELLDIQLIVLELDHSAFVLVKVAVVRGREDRDNAREALIAPVVHLETLKLHLVRSDQADQAVPSEELAESLEAENEGAASLLVRFELAALLPCWVVHWVRPEQVAEQALQRRFVGSAVFLQTGDGSQLRGNPSMQRDELLIDNRSDRKVVEEVHKKLVNLLVKFEDAFLFEVEGGGHLPALVVASDHEEGLLVVYLKRENKEDHLDRELAPVNVVAQEEVLGSLWLPSDLEQLQKIVVLAVDIPDHCNWVLNLQNVRFFLKNCLGQIDDLDHVGFGHFPL